MKINKISYVIPCYNEAEVLPELYRRLTEVANSYRSYEFEFVLVNDGSVDNSAEILNKLTEKDQKVKVLHFSRNQGHQAAITAGMDFCSGDLVVTIDADLQDPPELVEEMIDRIKQGYDVVHMQRRKRAGETWFKLLSARGFYWLMKYLTHADIIENSGDFRAFTRPVLRALQGFREQHRFMRGLFAMVGFRQTVIKYDRAPRFAGQTQYSLHKMLRLASNAVLSFSSTPLKIIAWLSFLLWFISLVYLAKTLLEHFVLEITVPGWTSIIILMTFYTGIIIFCLSIIGIYIGRIFEQGQRRPLYWLYDVKNINLKDIDSVNQEVKLSNYILDTKHDY